MYYRTFKQKWRVELTKHGARKYQQMKNKRYSMSPVFWGVATFAFLGSGVFTSAFLFFPDLACNHEAPDQQATYVN